MQISEVEVFVTDVNWLKRKILSFTTGMPVRNPVEISVMMSVVFLALISGSLSPGHGASSGCRWRNGPQIGG